MCRIVAYKSTSCNHRWLTITTRCSPGIGFTTTPAHQFHNEGSSFSLGKPHFTRAPAGSCPNCDLRGQYDGNTTRLVLGSGEKEIRQNALRMRRGDLVGNESTWNPTYERPDVVSLGVCQQVRSGYGDQAGGAQYYPAAQRYTYGYDPSSCSIL